jgi:Uma2 family endonuclease
MSTAERPPKLTLPDHTQLPPADGNVEKARLTMPDHTQLPDSDGTFVKNFQEHPQSVLLTDSIGPVLDRRHPDGRYAIGQDCGIYWRLTEPLERGAVCPDWFYVPDVPPKLDGLTRRSYVLWQEHLPPLIVLEFVSGEGSEERDRTPTTGKFWVYEKVIRPAFYGIYEVDPGEIEMYHHVDNRFVPLPRNERGHFPIAGLGVEIGIWEGHYQNLTLPWMRWWDDAGTLLPTGHELAEFEANRAEREAERAEREAERAAREAERANRLAAQLRALGIEPEA